MADIGLVGLGVMGSNLSLNMAEKGYSVAVHNRTIERTDRFLAHAGNLAPKLVACKTLAELAAAVEPPRPIVIMVKAGPGRRRAGGGARPASCQGRHPDRRRQRQFPRHPPPGRGVSGEGHRFHRHGRLRRRGGCAPWTLDHGGRRHGGVGAGRGHLQRHRGEVRRASRAAPWSGRRAPAISSRRSTTASNMPTCR